MRLERLCFSSCRSILSLDALVPVRKFYQGSKLNPMRNLPFFACTLAALLLASAGQPTTADSIRQNEHQDETDDFGLFSGFD